MNDLAFWAIAGTMILIAAAAMIRSLHKSDDTAAQGGARDQAVYRDQLAEVDRDLARGTLDADEAKRLRVEISRRLLEADKTESQPMQAQSGALAVVAVAVAMIAALFLYKDLGAPGYADLPLAERLAQSDAMMKSRPGQAEAVASAPLAPAPEADPAFLDLMEKLRTAVSERPGDLTGLELLARNEAALGNLAASEAALRQIIATKADAAVAEDFAALAEVMIRAAGGYVSPEAEENLIEALKRDPTNGTARYFSGLMFAQAGRFDRSFTLWRALLEDSPGDAPWIAPIRDQMPDVVARAGVRYELPPLKGPSGEDVAAAAEMAPEDRQAMIETMVGQLSERLATTGGSVEEWGQLIRSLAVLGRNDEAKTIYAEAQETFAGRTTELSFLRQAFVEAGLSE